jgi:hypothetical protein
MAAAVPSSDWGQCAIATPAWAVMTAYLEVRRESRERVIYRAVQSGPAGGSRR